MLINDEKIKNIIKKITEAAEKENINSFIISFTRPDDSKMIIWHFQNIKWGSVLFMLKSGIGEAIENIYKDPIVPNNEKEIFEEMWREIESAMTIAENKMRVIKARAEIKKRNK